MSKMKLLNVALAGMLLCILSGIAFYLLQPKKEGVQGKSTFVPRPQEVVPQAIAPAVIPAAPVPEVLVAEPPTYAIEPKELTRRTLAAQARAKTLRTIGIGATVRAQGKEVVGAVVQCEAVTGTDSLRYLHSSLFAVMTQQYFADKNQTNEHGMVTTKFTYGPEFESGDQSTVGIGAYHPSHGSFYQEWRLDELEKNPEIEVNLERGKAVTGYVLDADGRPVPNALVSLAFRNHNDDISQIGLGSSTDANGAYELLGIQFSSVPIQISVTNPLLRPRDFPDMESFLAEVGTSQKFRTRFSGQFDAASQTWVAEHLVMPRNK